jgi:hypothetical protein
MLVEVYQNFPMRLQNRVARPANSINHEIKVFGNANWVRNFQGCAGVRKFFDRALDRFVAHHENGDFQNWVIVHRPSVAARLKWRYTPLVTPVNNDELLEQ